MNNAAGASRPLRIERGIPIPPRVHGSSAPRLVRLAPVLRRMSPGDSVFVPGKTFQQVSKQIARMAPAAFVTRVSHNGIRIWRTV